MDQVTKLKLKIGVHEFEAEGDPATVAASFEAFQSMVAAANSGPAAPSQSATVSALPAHLSTFGGMASVFPQPPLIVQDPAATASTDALLDKIMRIEGRTISLTVRPKNADDAVLLLLYGQKRMRENDSVTGAEVIDGITATGGLQVSRVDRLLEKAGRDGDVIVIGERRGKRYRLTNTGLNKARTIAAELIAIVA